jgi:hypothetical protein
MQGVWGFFIQGALLRQLLLPCFGSPMNTQIASCSAIRIEIRLSKLKVRLPLTDSGSERLIIN